MTPKHYEVLPWIIIVIVALVAMAVASWIGFDRWSDLREVTP
jgi:hypothetical protein